VSSAQGTAIITVGDEILGGFVLDTNSHWLAQQVREAGFPAIRIEVVPDQHGPIVEAVRRAVADPRAIRVLVSGGLGPTPDDRTLGALAEALGRPFEQSPQVLAHIQGIVERMHQAGWVASPEVSAGNRKMTLVPAGATVIFNRRGMAPGLAWSLEETPDGEPRWLLALPGVPRELQAMVSEEVVPRFFSGGDAAHVSELRYRYAIEAEFSEPMLIIEQEFPDVVVGSYPQTETRELIIRIRGHSRTRVDEAVTRMREMRPPSD